MWKKTNKLTALDASLTDKEDREAVEAVADEMIAWIKGRIEGNKQFPVSLLKRTDMMNLAQAAIARWVVVRSKQEQAAFNQAIDDLWRPGAPSENNEMAQLLG